MLRKLVNEAKFTLTLTTTGPVLIRSGTATLSSGRNPDMTPVQTYRHGQREVYFPGSSLKGVFRNHVEKIGRTLNELAICNPFVRQSFCGERLQKKDSKTAYARSCPVCRLFGSTAFIGRMNINDAYLVNAYSSNPVELRDGVGIDRFTGGAADKAKFDLEAVSSDVDFSTDIYVRNFECWQLGMILVIVQDLADGLIRIGSGTSRGLGGVVGRVSEITINHVGLPDKAPQEIWGLGKFLAETPQDYATRPDDWLRLETAPAATRQGLRLTSLFTDDALAELQAQAIDRFVTRIQAWEALP